MLMFYFSVTKAYGSHLHVLHQFLKCPVLMYTHTLPLLGSLVFSIFIQSYHTLQQFGHITLDVWHLRDFHLLFQVNQIFFVQIKFKLAAMVQLETVSHSLRYLTAQEQPGGTVEESYKIQGVGHSQKNQVRGQCPSSFLCLLICQCDMNKPNDNSTAKLFLPSTTESLQTVTQRFPLNCLLFALW